MAALPIEFAASCSDFIPGGAPGSAVRMPEQSKQWPKVPRQKRSSGAHKGVRLETWPALATTVMMRHIPTRYLPEELLMDFCQKGFQRSIDFFYLPMDFQTKHNKGYAFLNLCNVSEAARFHDAYNGVKLDRYTTRKVVECSPAVDQGFCANVKKFTSSKKITRPVRNPWFMPMVFHSAPQGSGVLCAPLDGGSLPRWVQRRLFAEQMFMKQTYVAERLRDVLVELESSSAVEKHVRNKMLLAVVGPPPGLVADRDASFCFLA